MLRTNLHPLLTSTLLGKESVLRLRYRFCFAHAILLDEVGVYNEDEHGNGQPSRSDRCSGGAAEPPLANGELNLTLSTNALLLVKVGTHREDRNQ